MSEEATPQERDVVMGPWIPVVRADGWDISEVDSLYWAAVDGIAWNLLEQTMDTADRAPSQEALQEARRTAERVLRAQTLRAALGGTTIPS